MNWEIFGWSTAELVVTVKWRSVCVPALGSGRGGGCCVTQCGATGTLLSPADNWASLTLVRCNNGHCQ